MAEIMTQLHQDHINLSRLLAVLKSRLAQLNAGERPDYHLMQDVISYVVDYADTHHHPLEDVLYQYTIEHYPQHKDILNEVEHEHAVIKAASGAFQDMVEQILLDAIVPMDQFTQQLESFINQQLAHLNREEGRVFPLLEECLTADDWSKVEESLFQRDDPLFGDDVAEEYKRLYKELISESAVA